ncbi:TetR/AcrR family transcriptional regulator [Nocardioides pantholopis]|uniref:TetR/AcrR family transcriptional regulator n=1 Tax=Nocardioides pantholopis TaxID=2483798 RepID=UPI000F077BAE|nr:TetR/AcrR family transcriptional regulator [Nocardioides pantholopis]
MTTPVVRRRRSARQLDLLDRLVALMAAEGFAHLTLDDVAERLHCSKSTLYVLASSKQELVVEVVTQYFRTSAAVVEERVARVEGPLERVVAYLEAVSSRLALLSREFLEDLADFGPAAAVYRRNTELAADRIRELIAEGIAGGGLRSVHAAFTAEMIAATMFDIQRGELTARLGMDDAAAYAELSTLVVQLLAPADPPGSRT